MADIEGMMKRGLRVLARRMDDHASELVRYERPGIGSVQVRAVVSRYRDDKEAREGVVAVQRLKDFVVRREALVDAGLEQPERGDRIEQTLDDGQTMTYVAIEPGDGSSHYRQCDGFGISLRIHCQLVERS